MRVRRPFAFVCGVALLAGACAAESGPSGLDDGAEASPPSLGSRGLWPVDPAELDPAAPPTWSVDVLDRYPHDPIAFTQGLEMVDADTVAESTGLRGHSAIRLVRVSDGTVTTSEPIDTLHFGEGLTRVGDTVVQLTWQSGVAYRWQLPALTPLDPFTYDGEGWGLCEAGGRLAMSNGSARLTWRDPTSFEALETVEVLDQGRPVSDLNELECIDDLVVANVWRTDQLVVIRRDGAVIARIDASPLVAEIAASNGDDVLNGVADLGDGTLLLGGKRWPTFFRVRLIAP